jgi:diaminopimelate decarboxylase
LDPAEFTPHFAWKPQGKTKRLQGVFSEDVPLERIAQQVGTPTYIYSSAAIEDAFRELDRGAGKLPHTLCFAVKSNSNLALLQRLAKIGSGFDVVSGGELALLERIGVPGSRIVFSGVGKSRDEMRAALRYGAKRGPKRGKTSGILLFNVESEPELETLMEESALHRKRSGSIPAVSIRVNPDVQAGGHPHISTGRYQHKFGIDWPEAQRLYRSYSQSKFIQWRGISVHIGSQIVGSGPFRDALKRLASYVRELQREGIGLKYLDFGGGLGVRYTNEKPLPRIKYAQMIAQVVRPLGLHLLLEPGRTIVGPAGILLTRVLFVKENRGKKFVVVDAAMNDLMRPALYAATHPISRVTRQTRGRGPIERVDIVGPVCETGDCFLRDWPLENVATGDLLAIWVAGAYGMSQSSNYNSRGRAAEVLVEGNRFRVVRRRESHQDLLRGQTAAL